MIHRWRIDIMENTHHSLIADDLLNLTLTKKNYDLVKLCSSISMISGDIWSFLQELLIAIVKSYIKKLNAFVQDQEDLKMINAEEAKEIYEAIKNILKISPSELDKILGV